MTGYATPKVLIEFGFPKDDNISTNPDRTEYDGNANSLKWDLQANPKEGNGPEKQIPKADWPGLDRLNQRWQPFYFSAFPFQLLAHSLYKSYIFLIGNGILMFIAKTSGLLSSQEAKKMMGNGNIGMQAEPSETEGSLLEAEVSKESDHHHVAALVGEEDGSSGRAGDFSLVIKSSSRPQKKAMAHHRRTGPCKTKPWDVRRGPLILSSKLPLLRCLSPP
ncbi:hypothetical protein RJ640_013041 [Escallonia rubra]|uniref:Uncharacterized protein n=1 Tax=Escallonia rubra TaxID=112253 RepID=A0AA88RXN3_9ASTE|nr:hypothetical protein RJ640_013041 [Escallonia rubra]